MPHTLTGNIQLVPAFESRFLRETRDLVVFLPPGYDDNPARRYPVLYMQDGQNLFDAATAFLGNEWRLDETAGELIGDGRIEPLIICGIYNTGVNRIGDYTPVRDRHGRGGNARRYGKLLVREVKPYLDRRFRTLPGSDHTGLGGSSLGALATLFLGLEYPEVFGKLAVMSPSVWWAHRDIVKRVNQLRHGLGTRIWLDTGTAEGDNPDQTTRDAQSLNAALLSKGWRRGGNLSFVEYPGAQHNEDSWGRRAGDALRFLFPPP